MLCNRAQLSVLRQVSAVGEIPLLTIFDRLCQVEKTPKLWKKANANPIFSKGQIVSKELQAAPPQFSS